MMSYSKLNYNKADNKTKLLIHGYSREQMGELSINLPSMIQYIFIMYYWIQEKFTILGDNMYLDETNPNLIHLKHARMPHRHPDVDLAMSNTAYGNNVINNEDTSISKYIWSFRYMNKYVRQYQLVSLHPMSNGLIKTY